LAGIFITGTAKEVNFANREDIVCVFVAAEEIPGLRGKDAIHHSNVIILNQTAIERCYGPTIMGAAAMSATCLRAARADRQRVAQAAAVAQAAQAGLELPRGARSRGATNIRK
jgi:hypothetical protein